MAKQKTYSCEECGKSYSRINVRQVVCGPLCAVSYNSAESIQRRFDKMKAENMRMSELLFKAKAVFQKWVRLRDKNDPCISCNNTDAKQWDAGHFYSAEEYPGLIFHQDNAHKQCSYCNDQLKGNLMEYRPRLLKKIGIENVEYLELLSAQAKKHVFSNVELLRTANLYKDKIKLSNKT